MHHFFAVIADFLTAFVALLHLYILVLEMFLWEKPYGRKVFKMSREVAAVTATLAKNQGLYNGFLAAGLIWSLLTSDPGLGIALKFFFLSCVSLAGIFGSFKAKREILYIQGAPALLALAALVLSVN